MKLSGKKRGSLLTLILVVGAIVLVGVAVMFSSVQMSMASDSKFNHQEAAEDAARSAIQMVLAEFKSGDFEFHDDVKFEDPGTHYTGTVTFSDNGGPYSTNNIVSSSGKVGWKEQLVPSHSAHLVAVGEAAGQKQVLEIIIHQEAFPWSVASNGTIQGNDMEVFSLNSLEEVTGGITEDEKQRSDILSNASGQSITLTGNSNISGDAKAVGKVALSGSSAVKGKTEEDQDPTNIILAKRANDYRPPAGEYRLYTPGKAETISGWYLANGNTVIGDVTFEDGMIFVDGNAEVTGKISGVGALVATGNIKVTGSMNTEADLAALVAGGDIEINGVGTNTSSFQGLILAEGSFKAKDTTLIGSALTLDKNGSVRLERVRTVAAKDFTKVDLNYAVELKKVVNTNYGTLRTDKASIRYQGPPLIFEESNYSSLESLGQQLNLANSTPEFGIVSGDRFYLPSDPGFSALDPDAIADLNTKIGQWNEYMRQVKEDRVVYVDVFQLDFNKFLKAKGGFRALLQRVNPL